MKISQFLQAVLSAANGSLRSSSAILLAIKAFLASAVGAQVLFCWDDDGKYNDAVKFWFDSAKCKRATENEIQKKLTEPFSITKFLN